MKIVVAQPPNLAEIDRVFPNRGKGIVLAFGDKIYNPENVDIPKFILAHEGAHGSRQVSVFGIDRWWRSYLDDPEFRYREEVIGHAAEYLSLMNGEKDRNRRASFIVSTVSRLLAPFYEYGGKFSSKQATHDLKHAVHRMGG